MAMESSTEAQVVATGSAELVVQDSAWTKLDGKEALIRPSGGAERNEQSFEADLDQGEEDGIDHKELLGSEKPTPSKGNHSGKLRPAGLSPAVVPTPCRGGRRRQPPPSLPQDGVQQQEQPQPMSQVQPEEHIELDDQQQQQLHQQQQHQQQHLQQQQSVHYMPLEASQLATAVDIIDTPPTPPRARWVDPEARYQWASRARFRFYANIAAVVFPLIVAAIGLGMVIDRGRHGFHPKAPARPRTANIEGLIRLPKKGNARKQVKVAD